VLTVAAVPAWVAANMVVTNQNGASIGVVSSGVPGSTTITCAANVTTAVAIGDVLTFSLKGATGLADHVRRGTAGYTAQWSGT
jgi:sensor histidine kinase regulating citrate/malate metabolism